MNKYQNAVPPPNKEESVGAGVAPLQAGLITGGLLQNSYLKLGLKAFALVFALVIAYVPALDADFIWDDNDHLTHNPCVVGPDSVIDLWTTAKARICPLVQTSFWAMNQIWGLSPSHFHWVNILLHALSALVLWRLLVLLHVPGAWLGAALWAWHPVQVETVAWITELKNVQSGLFYLLTLLCFVKSQKAVKESGAKPRRWWFYAFSVVLGVLAVASKTSTVILPAIVGLLLWWQNDGRVPWRKLPLLLPYVLIAAAGSALSIWTQSLEGASDAEWQRTWPEKLSTAGWVIWFYLGKLLWPNPLIFVYPRWDIDPAQFSTWLPSLAVILVSLLLWLLRKKGLLPVFIAWAYFCLALIPVLGLAEHFFLRYSFVGDHFQYLASIGPLALIGAGASRLLRHLSGLRRLAHATVCLAVCALLVLLSWRHAHVFQNNEMLWSDTIKKNPSCWMACNNLSIIMLEKGEAEKALNLAQRALDLRKAASKSYHEAFWNAANALMVLGRFKEAIEVYQQSIDALKLLQQQGPYREDIQKMAGALISLGGAYIQDGSSDEAEKCLQQVLARDDVDPAMLAMALNNLGTVFKRLEQMDKAVHYYEKAIELSPKMADAQRNLGLTLLTVGRSAEGLKHCQLAADLKPNDGEILANYGTALAINGRGDEAVKVLMRAAELAPRLPWIPSNLGNILLELGRPEESIIFCTKAVELQPDLAGSWINLGRACLQQEDFPKALESFQRAVKLEPGNVDARFNLAQSLGLAGKSAEAVEQLRKVVSLKPDFPLALNSLAWLLATSPDPALRSGQEALQHAQAAVDLSSGADPRFIKTLAAAYAECGRFNDALNAVESALSAPGAPSIPGFQRSLFQEREYYRAHKPFREPPTR